jgi:glycerol-3-phosphate dehydrogenase
MNRDFSKLENQSFDLLVCGGGIYGAWTAYDAALRGLKVALVDKGDWASATSSASSKLIHGGLRYLESLDFRVVKKSLRERQMLMKAAPHRVWPLRFGIPVFKNGRLGGLRLKAGLILYDLLAGIDMANAKHCHFSRAEFADHFPYLDPSLLLNGFTYLDAQTDDARFVLELIDGALAVGAVCLNYCEVTDFVEQGQLKTAQVVDKISGRVGRVFAKQVVNVTGQWIAVTEMGQRLCRLTKGVHLIMPRILISEALLLTAQKDGRVFFMIPWYGLTLLGTTDTDYYGDFDQVKVEKDDIDYLLNEANRVLKSGTWTEADVIGQYAGLRVLQNRTSASPSAVSREWELKITENGHLLSIGGKFTSAREDAAMIVDTVCRNLSIHETCKTFGRRFPWIPDAGFNKWSESVMSQAAKLYIDEESAFWLIRRHGSRVADIFDLIEDNPGWVKRIVDTLPFIIADLVFSAENEMVVHLEDLLRRRTPLLILAKMTPAEITELAELVAEVMDWDEDTIKEEVEVCCQNSSFIRFPLSHP